MTVTVAIPTRNGGAVLEETLAAVRAQRLGSGNELHLLVCDSGSTDASVATARTFDAEVIEIGSDQFSHGGTRNLLMERARGDHVAFLTQDAVPADEGWLKRLLDGFALAGDVALVFGPYRARPDASVMVTRELAEWFRSFAPDGKPRIDRLDPPDRGRSAAELMGPRGFFTDANGCVLRTAWEKVRFREVPYAEDHLLAHDTLRAGFAKVFLPDAVVVHSHDYSPREWLRRSFDEGRAMKELYGLQEPRDLRTAALRVWGLVGADWRWARDRSPGLLVRSLDHHVLRTVGTMLGARAERLPSAVVRRLSLEGRR